MDDKATVTHDDIMRWSNAQRAVYELLPPGPERDAALSYTRYAARHAHTPLDTAAYHAAGVPREAPPAE